MTTNVAAGAETPGTQHLPVQTTSLDIRGPYDLAEVALMGFGHRDERQFDGVMRMAFCLDTDYQTPVGVEARQEGVQVELTVRSRGPAPLDEAALAAVTRQVARVISLDHDGEAFDALCRGDPVLARLHAVAPGFRPALFYSPYEAAVWSVVSARRPRNQGIALRQRLCELYGTTHALAGRPTAAVPTPSALRAVEAVPGLPADRVPRLHAIAEAAQDGRLSVDRLRALPPAEAAAELQQLPGIGPFFSSLIVIRALGHADVLPAEEAHARSAVEELYGIDSQLTAAELEQLAEGWRPFRTWVMVSARALGERLAP
jgi:DNA-3-methyladenine glycosylase II